MAKPYKEITKTDFRNLYNITKILVAKADIMEFLKTYNEKLDIIIKELKTINTRLDKHDELFKAHGWIK